MYASVGCISVMIIIVLGISWEKTTDAPDGTKTENDASNDDLWIYSLSISKDNNTYLYNISVIGQPKLNYHLNEVGINLYSFDKSNNSSVVRSSYYSLVDYLESVAIDCEIDNNNNHFQVEIMIVFIDNNVDNYLTDGDYFIIKTLDKGTDENIEMDFFKFEII